jgi:hypothetical protein
MSMETLNKMLAIVPIQVGRVEAEVVGGFALNKTRSQVVTSTLVLPYRVDGQLRAKGTTVYLDGLAGNEPWAKKVFSTPSGETFVLVPESRVIALG